MESDSEEEQEKLNVEKEFDSKEKELLLIYENILLGDRQEKDPDKIINSFM